MEIRFQPQNHWKSDIALLFAFENETIEEIEKRHKYLFQVSSWLTIAPAWRDFSAKAKELLLIYGHKDNEISRAYVIGLGKKEDLSIATLRNAIVSATKACKNLKLENIGIDISSLEEIRQVLGKKKFSYEYLVEEVCTCANLATYSFTKYKSKDKSEKKSEDKVASVLSLLIDAKNIPDEVHTSAILGQANAKGMCLSRDLGNEPANVLNPVQFAKEAEKVAKKHDFKLKVLDKKELETLGLNTFLAVAQGSSNDPRLIVLEYTPKKCPKDAKPFVFVGKGLTFDSGGISLKPSKGMDEMKTDMCGAAALLGLFEALGEAKSSYVPNRPIIALLGCAENMPDGNAVRPGDVIKTYNGKTVEITNTDAEGRLVLIDTLTYAQKNYKAEYLIDIATLTGACLVALGDEAAGIFVNDDTLAQKLTEASDRSGELVWRMPLWEHMLRKIDSHIADIDNAGAREGGAISAAVFIQQFIEKDQKWAHIDMAGPNFANAERGFYPKGATGYGTRLLFDFIRNN